MQRDSTPNVRCFALCPVVSVSNSTTSRATPDVASALPTRLAPTIAIFVPSAVDFFHDLEAWVRFFGLTHNKQCRWELFHAPLRMGSKWNGAGYSGHGRDSP